MWGKNYFTLEIAGDPKEKAGSPPKRLSAGSVVTTMGVITTWSNQTYFLSPVIDHSREGSRVRLFGFKSQLYYLQVV